MSKEDWNDIKKVKPEKDVLVEIKHKNGMVVEGKFDGNWIVIDPSLSSVELLMAPPISWRPIQPKKKYLKGNK